jgi:hypothetical protein
MQKLTLIFALGAAAGKFAAVKCAAMWIKKLEHKVLHAVKAGDQKVAEDGKRWQQSPLFYAEMPRS